MKFGKRYSKGTVFMAMLHGVIIGVAAVALIGFILISTNGKQTEGKPKTKDEELPITGPAPVDPETPAPVVIGGESIELFARQHGVFTMPESARAFIAEEPSLTSAAVIKAEGQYYVWSVVGLSEAQIMDSESEGSFRKRFVADVSACGAIGAGKLQNVLTANEISKIKISDAEKEDEKSAEFNQNIAAITAFTSDFRIIRLHLISHYSTTKECIKITF